MRTYLLDTNVCIALINGQPAAARDRFHRAMLKGGVFLLSSVAAFELWYGVAKSRHKEVNTERVLAFLAGPLELMPFDDEDARTAGAIRAELEAVGTPIGSYDLLLAGQARRHAAILVTSNTREFDRVSGLKWEDWAAVRKT